MKETQRHHSEERHPEAGTQYRHSEERHPVAGDEESRGPDRRKLARRCLADLLGVALSAAVAVGCSPSGPEAPSGSDLAPLTQRLQAELDRQYESAQSTDEVFPGATAAVALPDGRVLAVADP